ncbi:MAG: topoisomerase DNA-binding C4 zinc finger domain-containing protein, partial [Alphaproteobacteria bacterium]|nr:topoisomerase DNA-binding C4 zinc finger domain-containing protein [Alphaproteobacteria bacterium]
DWKEVLRNFWRDFSAAVDCTKELTISQVLAALDAELGRHFFPDEGSGRDPRLCPGCGAGRLSIKLGKFGAFIGCSNYPNCRYTRALALEAEADESQVAETPLGTDPGSGLPVFLKKGPYGYYVQLGPDGEDRPKRVAVPRSTKPAEVDLDTALRLLALPRVLGRHPETGETILAGIGRFGAYIKHGSTFKSLPADEDVLTIGLNRAVVLLAEPSAERRRGPQVLRELGEHPDGGAVVLCRGRYGPYLSHQGVFASLPKSSDPDTLTLQEAIPLLSAQQKKSNGRQRKSVKVGRGKAATEAGARRRAAAGAAKKTSRKARSRSNAAPG